MRATESPLNKGSEGLSVFPSNSNGVQPWRNRREVKCVEKGRPDKTSIAKPDLLKKSNSKDSKSLEQIARELRDQEKKP